MALKMVYKLAKMVKEARDNVIFIRNKLDSTVSTEQIILALLERVDPKTCPDGVFEAIKLRLAENRRTTRRMRLKYEPLMMLLNGLGGSAALIKAQAAMLRKGILGCTMTLGSVSVLVRRHIERLEARALHLQAKLSGALTDGAAAVTCRLEDAQHAVQQTAQDKVNTAHAVSEKGIQQATMVAGSVQKQAQKMQSLALEEANKVIQNAQKRAAVMERQSTDKAQSMIAQAKQDGEKVRQQSQAKAAAIVTKAKKSADAVRRRHTRCTPITSKPISSFVSVDSFLYLRTHIRQCTRQRMYLPPTYPLLIVTPHCHPSLSPHTVIPHSLPPPPQVREEDLTQSSKIFQAAKVDSEEVIRSGESKAEALFVRATRRRRRRSWSQRRPRAGRAWWRRHRVRRGRWCRWGRVRRAG